MSGLRQRLIGEPSGSLNTSSEGGATHRARKSTFSAVMRDAAQRSDWDSPGWGMSESVTVYQLDGHIVRTNSSEGASLPLSAHALSSPPPSSPPPSPPPHASLDQYRATAIAGNDLLSSCLYTAGLCAKNAGKMAPISLSLVGFMLYFFRFIYAEVVTALPVNGGSYNALLNTTSKRFAALAACLSLISYIATAVVSGLSAIKYLSLAWEGINIAGGTVGLLACFAMLTLIGVGESSVVATIIFVFHVICLLVLTVWSYVYGIQDGFSTFTNNWRSDDGVSTGNAGSAIFFGYATALLGITGFETAANYVEEMKDGKTYVQTLRNMWWTAALFNPIISLGAMAVLDMKDIMSDQNSQTLLAAVAQQVGGNNFRLYVCIDGFIVLAGSVLTAYVGAMGLVRRMALDRCLPEFLMTLNRWRGTPHYTIMGFFLLTASLFLALYVPNMSDPNNQSSVDTLAGVYDIAFLSVMTAFAGSAIILKWKRPDLPRLVVASWGSVFIALIFVISGLIGNIIMDPGILGWFALYFGIAFVAVFSMFNRTKILQLTYYIVRACMATRRERDLRSRKAQELQRAHVRTEAARLAAHALHTNHGASALAAEAVQPEIVGLPVSTRRPSLGAVSSGAKSSTATGRSSDGVALVVFDQGTEAGAHSNGVMAEDAVSGLLAVEEKSSTAAPQYDNDAVAVLEAGGERTWRGRITAALSRKIQEINSTPVVFFAKEGDLATLNKAILYVRDNELTSRLVVVHVVDDTNHVAKLATELEAEAQSTSVVKDISPATVAAKLQALPPLNATAKLVVDTCCLLDAVYPKLRIDSLIIRGSAFCPGVIRFVSHHLGVSPNMMFMAMPDERFSHQFAALGGLRVITRAAHVGDRALASHRLLEVLQKIQQDKEDELTAASQ